MDPCCIGSQSSKSYSMLGKKAAPRITGSTVLMIKTFICYVHMINSNADDRGIYLTLVLTPFAFHVSLTILLVHL